MKLGKLDSILNMVKGLSVYLSDPVARNPISGFRLKEIDWKYKEATVWTHSFVIEGHNVKTNLWDFVCLKDTKETALMTISAWARELKKKRIKEVKKQGTDGFGV